MPKPKLTDLRYLPDSVCILTKPDSVSGFTADNPHDAMEQMEDLAPLPVDWIRMTWRADSTPKLTTWHQRYFVGGACVETGVSFTEVNPIPGNPPRIHSVKDQGEILTDSLDNHEHAIAFAMDIQREDLATERLNEIDDVEERIYIADKYNLQLNDCDDEYARREHKAYVAGILL